jgi:hypothetical protein
MSHKNYFNPPLPFSLDNKCVYCNIEFGYLNWSFWGRHHCRSCGSSTCTIHSYLKDSGNKESRKCITIYEFECERKRAQELHKMVNKNN